MQRERAVKQPEKDRTASGKKCISYSWQETKHCLVGNFLQDFNLWWSPREVDLERRITGCLLCVNPPGVGNVLHIYHFYCLFLLQMEFDQTFQLPWGAWHFSLLDWAIVKISSRGIHFNVTGNSAPESERPLQKQRHKYPRVAGIKTKRRFIFWLVQPSTLLCIILGIRLNFCDHTSVQHALLNCDTCSLSSLNQLNISAGKMEGKSISCKDNALNKHPTDNRLKLPFLHLIPPLQSPHTHLHINTLCLAWKLFHSF